ncbi:MAG TPA: hypothetical protein VGM38_02525 [Pseudolysinimonas sp.]|jgi:hypothetical protein
MTEDDEIADRLLLPPCRPELMLGIPYYHFLALWAIWAVGLIVFGAIITGTGLCVIAGLFERGITAWDFNAIPVAMVYRRTKLVATRSTVWISGVTLDPLYGQRKPR